MSRAEGHIPTRTWCDQGHVMLITSPACPECRNATAVICSDLLEQLHLGLLLALEPDPLIECTQGETETLRLLAEDRLTREWC